MLRKINHIGIAVHDIAAAAKFYTDNLALVLEGVEEVVEQKVKVAFLPVGEVRIELLEPTSPESPIAKFLEKNGPGVHHIAYGVDDVAAALEKLKGEEVKLVDQVPRRGAHGTLIAFLHPKSSGGVLTELVQEMGHH